MAAAIEAPSTSAENVAHQLRKTIADVARADNTELVSDAFTRLERFGFERLNAKSEAQPTSRAKPQKFPISADCAGEWLTSVWSSTNADAIARARRLAETLVDLQLTKLDDAWMERFISAVVRKAYVQKLF